MVRSLGDECFVIDFSGPESQALATLSLSLNEKKEH